MAGRQGKRRVNRQLIEDEDYQRKYERVAAIDVAKASGVVCVRLPPPAGGRRRVSRIETVAATMGAVSGLAARLLADGVQMVSMESTSDYWRIWYYVLEAAGVPVQLVNSSQAKNLPGRPKTDREDSQWQARLTEMGLLRPSFVPPKPVRDLRDYTRMRIHLVHDRTRCWQRLEKLLEGALIKVSAVASKLGTLSVRDMLEALIAGERDPTVLAGLARGPMRAKRGELVQALAGVFDDHHGELAQLHLDQITFLDRKITALEDRITGCLEQLPQAQGVDADGTTGPGAGTGPDAPVLAAVPRLAQIPGVSEQLARSIIAETGLDMSKFPTPGHLVNWAGLAPTAHQSGPRARKGKKGQGDSYARGCLTQAANGTARTQTFLGERFRRITRRRGTAIAQVAVARSILVIIWHLLHDPTARYRDLGPDHYTTKTSTDKKIRGHIRQLQALGLDVTVTPRAA